VIWNSNLDFRVNPDPDIYQIAPNMFEIHYPVTVSDSHVTECHEDLLVTVSEMLMYLLKSPIPQW